VTPTDLLTIEPQVAEALAAGRPVVALESTIITHGMPFPHNLEMAEGVETVIRERGAVPATVAIIGGRLLAGLDRDALEGLARAGGQAAKASRRDLAALLAAGGMAGTTVATTMYVASVAGIEVFATGGIGGVHRGAEETFDVSADLMELGRSPVAVVCSGAKSILDIGKTLEVLESHGVPVLGYRTDQFPAFWAQSSGHKADRRVDTPEAAAAILRLQFDLGLGGALIANPIPEADAWDAAEIERHITSALADAQVAGVSGKDITPYLLRRVFELTGGRSLEANIALVRNNAAVAADIAVALADLRRGDRR